MKFSQKQIAIHDRERWIAHLAEFSPAKFKEAGTHGVRALVGQILPRCQTYGLRRWDSVRLFLETSVLLGSFFDSDPQYQWATRILTDPALQTGECRAERLFQCLQSYLFLVVGDKRQLQLAALDRALNLDVAHLQGHAWLPSHAVQLINHLYPEKVSFAGGDAIEQSVSGSDKDAADLIADSSKSAYLVAGMRIAFGRGFFRDPMIPWASQLLKIHRESREVFFESRARAYLLAIRDAVAREALVPPFSSGKSG